MSGFFGCVSRKECVADVFYGTDYHSHLALRVRISGTSLNRNWSVSGVLTWVSG